MKHKIFPLLFCLALAFLSCGSVPFEFAKTRTAAFVFPTPAQQAQFQDGDLLFRRASSMASHFIMSVDPDSSFSHVGLIHRKGETITVISAVPNDQSQAVPVSEQTLEEFLQDIPLAAVYRLRADPDGAARRAEQAAEKYVGTVGFDFKFNLEDSRQMYCTELVWKAYQAAGVDLVDQQFSVLSAPFLPRGNYILPSDLLRSRWLIQVLLFNSPT